MNNTKAKVDPKRPDWWPYSWDWKRRQNLWNNGEALEHFRLERGFDGPYTAAAKPIWWPTKMPNNQELWDNPAACERMRQNLALEQMKREKDHKDYGYSMEFLTDLSMADTKKKCTIM